MPQHHILSLHTFGRDHSAPQPSEVVPIPKMPPAANEEWQEARHTGNDAGLPDDFDHLVRSIGEW